MQFENVNELTFLDLTSFGFVKTYFAILNQVDFFFIPRAVLLFNGHLNQCINLSNISMETYQNFSCFCDQTSKHSLL